MTAKVVSVEAFPIRIARDLDSAKGTAGTPNAMVGSGDYRWSKDYPCLYATHIESALVRVRLDSGLTGWGECQAPLAPEVPATIVERLLRPILTDEPFDGSPARIEELYDRMYAAMRVRGQTGGFMLDAIAGVDLALWDLAGKMAGLPVSALLAADRKTSVPAYLSGVGGESLEARVANAREAYQRGFRLFKLYLESDLSALLAQVDAIRGLGAGVEVAVDGLWHIDPVEALRLDAHGVFWLECPFMPEDLKAHIDLSRSIETPLALGESYRTTWELRPFFENRAMRYVQPDLGRCGITGSMRIAREAAARGMQVVPHVSIALGPQIAAAVHFAAAAPACGMCEYNPRVLEVANRYLEHPIRLEQARYVVSEGEGLGADVVGLAGVLT